MKATFEKYVFRAWIEWRAYDGVDRLASYYLKLNDCNRVQILICCMGEFAKYVFPAWYDLNQGKIVDWASSSIDDDQIKDPILAWAPWPKVPVVADLKVSPDA